MHVQLGFSAWLDAAARSAESSEETFVKNRKGGGEKMLFLRGCLELLLVGTRLQLQMC